MMLLPPGLESSDGLSDAVSALLLRIGIQDRFELHSLTGGANNRVYRVDTSETQLLLKSYFSHPDDPRDRLNAEFSFCQFAWDHGIRSVPEPLACDAANRLGLYGYLNGRRLAAGEISLQHVVECTDFFCSLNRSNTVPAARRLGAASEACFSTCDHLTCVERRVRNLETIPCSSETHQAAAQFVCSDLLPKWSAVVESTEVQCQTLELQPDLELAHGSRVVSPSDFGFHNAIVDGHGRLRFIDFEYAGWDDPAKMVCDFFCQIEVPVPREYLAPFVDAVVAMDSQPELLRNRIELLFPVYQIKWCCITLNEFLPTAAARRRFSDTGAGLDSRQQRQLEKAKRIFSEIDL